MSRNPFGWNYPPGVSANDPNAPWNQQESPCAMCGKSVDACICLECPVCKSVGDPFCYDHHGLVQSDAQKTSLREAEDLKEEALLDEYNAYDGE